MALRDQLLTGYRANIQIGVLCAEPPADPVLRNPIAQMLEAYQAEADR